MLRDPVARKSIETELPQEHQSREMWLRDPVARKSIETPRELSLLQHDLQLRSHCCSKKY